MNTVLITGITGFAGSFLTSYLLKNTNQRIIGTYHSGRGLDALKSEIGERGELLQADLNDAEIVDRLIGQVKPDAIYHLAALASPSQSFKDPALTFSTNITGQINVLESVKKHNLLDAKVLIVSSAEVYGIVDESDLPIDEQTSLNPTSPYAVSKIAQDFLGLQYALSYKLPIYRVRPFNHIGPRQTDSYVVASFAKQIVEIEKGEREPCLKVGNLNARRDFTDVRDIVRAYHLTLEKGTVGEVYNIGSGVSHQISEILKKLVSMAKVTITIEVDQERLKPIDIPDNRADISKITSETGWKPEIPLETSLENVLDYWRNFE